MNRFNQDFWIRYKLHINQNSILDDYIILDGFISEKYLRSNTKVLFILKESNESKEDRHQKDLYSEGGWFYNYYNGIHSEGKPRDKMITKMIKMNKAINYYISNRTIDSEIIKNNFSVDNHDAYDFAFININKRGNGQNSCKTDLNEIFDLDREYLLEQISQLNPDIIICGVKCLEEKLNTFLPNSIKKIYTFHFSILSYDDFCESIKEKL